MNILELCAAEECIMNKKKLLIYYPESMLKPVGGPSGYLYNLKQGLCALSATIEMPVDISFYEAAPKSLRDTVKYKDKIPKRLREFRRAIDDIFYEKKAYPLDEILYEYDMIHFHSIDAMYLNRRTLENYKGKVILTSHSPCAKYKEKLAWLNPFDYKVFKKLVERIENMDRYAFERADYIIFPCEEAEEPYYHTWEGYEQLRDNSKYWYMPTGIVGCTARIGREEYRKKYGIPKEAFVISYVGRHNEIKGYADLKKMGEELLVDKNIYFLIAGKEEPMKGLENDHWIEIGWTNDPHSLIAAADVFVLPNHETYFDLILLEVLSLGVPVVMSRTGGNKYFERFKQTGLKFYDNLYEAKNKILEIKQMSDYDLDKAKAEMIELFNQEFTVEQFAKNYVNIVSKIATL